MSGDYLQLRRIDFRGPKADADLDFVAGVNVICGASDTGKSFLAEAIDFMLGGSVLREIPERAKYAEIRLDVAAGEDGTWRLQRSASGGNFKLIDPENPDRPERVLKQSHAHDKTDNISGLLLEKVGLLGKRILKSAAKSTTQSLSFRNLARLVIIQEGEIQDRGSPFWSGQFTTKTSDLATVKLLLTGIDDSSVVTAPDSGSDNAKQISLIEELLVDISTEIEDAGEDRDELVSQMERLETSIERSLEELNSAQRELDVLIENRRTLVEERRAARARLDEISELLARFDLLMDHYDVDMQRLDAIRESGSMFAHMEAVTCPVCGAHPESQHLELTCEGNVDAIVTAAAAEIDKIKRLRHELDETVSDLRIEEEEVHKELEIADASFQDVSRDIQQTLGPEVSDVRTSFSALVEERAKVQASLSLFGRRGKLQERLQSLINEEGDRPDQAAVQAGLPESVAHSFSQKVSSILKQWNFPGECLVHYDKQASDFVIDGKPRGSRGKGLRAITHAAVSIALLEFCQEEGLSHPGFVVLDSPLLAYFKPEGDDDLALKGTDLKERFYKYLIEHHGRDSQVIIIENQHPPENVIGRLAMTVFTGNPSEGRFGLL
ncbi:AAA family ATPase [Sinorhizobium medicae]|nr:AAA family ATPase [Sinorhizobium medicae]MDX1162502.1 AAA family ATPase [Sinorhizobium medicae]